MGESDDTLRAAVRDGLKDESGAKARESAARAICDAMRDAGHALWLAGYFVGPDRVSSDSPFGFGNDVMVGIATGLQVGGELIAGVIAMLEGSNRYAAMALVRQLVEVEYLGWAFAEDEDHTAATWLRSGTEHRRKLWQPRHLRDSSMGVFRGRDYALHCELGGHPTPEARRLLPDHAGGMEANLIWFELYTHGLSAWDYFAAAITEQHPAHEVVANLDSVVALHEASGVWQETDPFIGLLSELRSKSPED